MWWLMAWRVFGCHGWVDALQAPWKYGSLSVVVSVSFKSSSIDAITEFSFFFSSAYSSKVIWNSTIGTIFSERRAYPTPGASVTGVATVVTADLCSGGMLLVFAFICWLAWSCSLLAGCCWFVCCPFVCALYGTC